MAENITPETPAAADSESRSSESRPSWQFKPGQSGNPGGRPKGEAEVRALAQAHGPAAIRGLIEIATSPTTQAAVKVAAWRELLDRGYGRAPQSLDVTVKRSLEDVLTEVSVDESAATDDAVH